jgi:Flagellar biosynthesis protein, FliO
MQRPHDKHRSPRAGHESRWRPRCRFPARRVSVWAGLLAVTLAASPARAGAEDGGRHPSAGSGSESSETRSAHTDRARRPRSSGFPWPGGDPGGTRSAAADAGWSAMACFALVLAACGGVAVAVRRLGPRAAAGAVQVVGRVSLSPKHSVYLLRVGRRVLLVGAGPQGPPALITELEDGPQEPPGPHQEAAS